VPCFNFCTVKCYNSSWSQFSACKVCLKNWTSIIFSPQQKEVISSRGELISNSEETPCNMESVTFLIINYLTVMDIHFSYSIQKITTNGLLFHHPCIYILFIIIFYILIFLRIISIHWTTMEMLWTPLHQFASFTSATRKHMQINVGFRDFLWTFSNEFIVHS
jgi:hypothetical protein